jgi:P27 family predicted phage terminase small subunit
LSELAREAWDELAPDLEAMGTIKVSDWVALSALCETYSRWRRINQMTSTTPPIFKRGQDEDGQPYFVKNPLYAQIRDTTAELRVMLREFGLTPSARSGLKVDLTVHHAAERLFTGSGI